jgi:hypothetical protein
MEMPTMSKSLFEAAKELVAAYDANCCCNYFKEVTKAIEALRPYVVELPPHTYTRTELFPKCPPTQ